MVLHKCDVRNCVNPDHLYLGTQSDNMRDCRDRGRRFQPEIRGEKNPMAVLTEKKVKEMRMIRKKKHTSYNKIAKLFGVSTMTAYRAVSGKCWV